MSIREMMALAKTNLKVASSAAPPCALSLGRPSRAAKAVDAPNRSPVSGVLSWPPTWGSCRAACYDILFCFAGPGAGNACRETGELASPAKRKERELGKKSQNGIFDWETGAFSPHSREPCRQCVVVRGCPIRAIRRGGGRARTSALAKGPKQGAPEHFPEHSSARQRGGLVCGRPCRRRLLLRAT